MKDGRQQRSHSPWARMTIHAIGTGLESCLGRHGGYGGGLDLHRLVAVCAPGAPKRYVSDTSSGSILFPARLIWIRWLEPSGQAYAVHYWRYCLGPCVRDRCHLLAPPVVTFFWTPWVCGINRHGAGRVTVRLAGLAEFGRLTWRTLRICWKYCWANVPRLNQETQGCNSQFGNYFACSLSPHSISACSFTACMTGGCNDSSRRSPTPRIVDDYLSKLQAGKQPDRAALLREHPELASSLKCLEALEGLAPAAGCDADLESPLCRRTGPAPRFRPLRTPGRNRPGRHGRGLQGAAEGARPHRGDQDDPGHAPGIAGTHPPLPGRGLGRRPPAAFQHHADPRRRPAPRPALLHDGIHRGRKPGPADCTAAAARSTRSCG